MSLNLKNFILDEGIKSSHAVKYLDYQDNFHDDVLEDLTSALSKQWKKTVEIRNSKMKPDLERAEEMSLKNPNSFLGIEFSTKEAMIGSGRFPKPKNTSLSVKISHAFNYDSRKILIREFLHDAQQVFENVVHKNEDAFSIKFKSGKHKTVFYVTTTDNSSVKIQFKTFDKKEKEIKEIVKTIFLVSVEHGKEGSKTKHYDRIYFIDYTRQ